MANANKMKIAAGARAIIHPGVSSMLRTMEESSQFSFGCISWQNGHFLARRLMRLSQAMQRMVLPGLTMTQSRPIGPKMNPPIADVQPAFFCAPMIAAAIPQTNQSGTTIIALPL